MNDLYKIEIYSIGCRDYNDIIKTVDVTDISHVNLIIDLSKLFKRNANHFENEYVRSRLFGLNYTSDPMLSFLLSLEIIKLYLKYDIPLNDEAIKFYNNYKEFLDEYDEYDFEEKFDEYDFKEKFDEYCDRFLLGNMTKDPTQEYHLMLGLLDFNSYSDYYETTQKFKFLVIKSYKEISTEKVY